MFRQRGFTLLELMLVLAIFAAVSVLSFQQKQRELAAQRAKELGTEIYQYNNAVRSWLARNAHDPDALGTYTGAQWLKSESCGGEIEEGEQPYLPCGFSDRTNFGNLLYTTVVSDDASDFETEAGEECANDASTSDLRVCAETTLPALELNGEIAPDLAGLAALTAAGGSASNLLPAQASTTASYGSDPETAEITMLASTNSTNDAWLRIDGGNTMAERSDIRWEGIARNDNDDNEIIGVDRIFNGLGEVLRIGNAGYGSAPLFITPDIIVDADQEILGGLEVRASFYAGGDIISGESITAAGDVNAGADVVADENVRAGGNIVTETGDFIAENGDVVLRSGVVRGKEFIEVDSPGYVLDPDGLSRLRDIQLDGGKRVSMAVYDAQIASNNSRVNKPDCRSSGGSPRILTAVSGISTDSTPKAIKAAFTYAVEYSGYWRVYMNVYDEDGLRRPSSAYGRILVLTKCG